MFLRYLRCIHSLMRIHTQRDTIDVQSALCEMKGLSSVLAQRQAVAPVGEEVLKTHLITASCRFVGSYLRLQDRLEPHLRIRDNWSQ
jgi:hypothetical protein